MPTGATGPPAPPEDTWLSAAEAAARLGVQAQTLYSYVSRGLLHSHPTPGRRASRYPRSEVERLAARSRSGGRPERAGALEIVVDTALTLLDPAGHLYYRGWDVIDAARTASYERVAEWLWMGRDDGEPGPWMPRPEAVAAVRRATTDLPTGATLVDRMRIGTAVAATTDPMRHDLRPQAVAAVGRTLVSTLVDSLPPAGGSGDGPDGASAPGGPIGGRGPGIAERLWPALSPRHPSRAELGVLNTALVLLADHELAASTLGARVAASTWADPYLVVQAGLGVLGGPLHGGATEAVREFLRPVAEGHGTPAEAVGEALRAGRVPGLGHAVYQGPDPRAGALLQALESARPPEGAWAGIQGVLGLLEERDLPLPNIDMAMGATAVCLGLAPGAGEAIFAVARMAGWLAHAMEEYQHRLRFRPRAIYLGSAPR
ncbi:MAG TPA: citrate/2-methylcitrate synthase [Acidimicrobiales bacterium]|nr:citrate/2-methylcitrate synthase [Acidimicrobiales bacterium]